MRVLVKLLTTSFLLVLLVGCRVHTLDDGVYALLPNQVLRDDCGLNAPGALTTGALRTEGNLVYLALASPELRLVGTYLAGVEQMTLDGNVLNYSAVLRGRECLLDTVSFHLDATTTSPSTFSGTMAINYDARQPDACVCRYWFNFEARRQ